METVEGASRLMKVVRGVDEHSSGLSSFATSMSALQQRLSSFNGSVEQALQGMMLELEAEIDAIVPMDETLGGGFGEVDDDSELANRISRLSGQDEQGGEK